MTDDIFCSLNENPVGKIVDVSDERRATLLGLLYKVVAAQTRKGEKTPAQEPDLWALKVGKWAIVTNGHSEEYFLWTGAPLTPGSWAFEYDGFQCGELILDDQGVRLAFADGKLDAFMAALAQEI